ncbi:hypothetical protein JVT61DRAFT_1403 [Boletus reticuloceps]|uniref:Uncharacterized protein n=1 Tax=Boletus reticuloceps TaxID=495285 RepID=A0A8I2YC16_9AGAM|nr:hypothetical protein JVT61DRAFT_1403 [Boletus reticuloceps]
MFMKEVDIDKALLLGDGEGAESHNHDANLGTLLLNNYRQALDIIVRESVALQEAMSALGVKEGDLEKWQAEEVDHFQMAGKEREWDTHAVEYVKLLQQLRDAQLETQRRHASEQLEEIQQQVISMELELGIQKCWEPSSPEYQETLKYISERKYHCALDNLQCLVVQRLFELQKLNILQTAYKMCMHIAKALQVRCRAIQAAVRKYNDAASTLQPPRQALNWSKVSHYSFLEEFTLLRET